LENYLKTLIGPRKSNQDKAYFHRNENSFIACIADGVGGNNCGEIASQLAINIFAKLIDTISSPDQLTSILSQVHSEILAYGKEHTECVGMATTFTGCYQVGNRIFGVHVGDSRLVILRGNGIRQLTIPHNEAYALVTKGTINLKDYLEHPKKNVLTSAIGAGRPLQIQSFSFDIIRGDRLLLSSDGFHDVFDKKELRDISLSSPDLKQFGDLLTYEITLKNLTDNCTFLLVEI
jgi:protein phosphatase